MSTEDKRFEYKKMNRCDYIYIYIYIYVCSLLPSSADIKLIAVKFKTMSITSDEVTTNNNAAAVAKAPCVKRSVHENTIQPTLSVLVLLSKRGNVSTSSSSSSSRVAAIRNF
jgi:hypothetical protein